eukprot:7685723-Pyramimonas_sp.AAC.1
MRIFPRFLRLIGPSTRAERWHRPYTRQNTTDTRCSILQKTFTVNSLAAPCSDATFASLRSQGGQEGIYRSSLDARKPQNSINSEEYQGHLQ